MEPSLQKVVPTFLQFVTRDPWRATNPGVYSGAQVLLPISRINKTNIPFVKRPAIDSINKGSFFYFGCPIKVGSFIEINLEVRPTEVVLDLEVYFDMSL